MKIRHPALIRAASFSIAWTIRLWISTLRYRGVFLDPSIDPTRPDLKERYLFAFWHETMLIPASQYSATPTKVLISQHADGEMIAQAIKLLGLDVVRGSSTRGGVEAVRQILKLQGKNHIVVTPDGPRGPRRVMQPGLVYLAARTRMPIVPVGFAYHRAWRLNSWDRFALPYPFSPAVGVIGRPIAVPEKVGRADIEPWREKAQAGMEEVMALAEKLATKERW